MRRLNKAGDGGFFTGEEKGEGRSRLAIRRSAIPEKRQKSAARFGNREIPDSQKYGEKGAEEDRAEKKEEKRFLRPESPRMQGKQEVGFVMCVISTL